MVLLQKLFSIYGVASDKAAGSDCFLWWRLFKRVKGCNTRTRTKWKDDELTGFNLENILSDDASWRKKIKNQASFKTYIGLAAAGFVTTSQSMWCFYAFDAALVQCQDVLL